MNHDSPFPSPSTTPIRTLLQQDGVTATLALLGPGETLPPGEHPAPAHVLFVIDGSADVQFDELNVLLKKDQALHVAKEKAATVRNPGDGWAKLLRIDLPARETTAAPIYTVADSSVFESEMSGR